MRVAASWPDRPLGVVERQRTPYYGSWSLAVDAIG